MTDFKKILEGPFYSTEISNDYLVYTFYVIREFLWGHGFLVESTCLPLRRLCSPPSSLLHNYSSGTLPLFFRFLRRCLRRHLYTTYFTGRIVDAGSPSTIVFRRKNGKSFIT